MGEEGAELFIGGLRRAEIDGMFLAYIKNKREKEAPGLHQGRLRSE